MKPCEHDDVNDMNNSALYRSDIDQADLHDLNGTIRESEKELKRLYELRANDVCPFKPGLVYHWTIGEKRPRKRYGVISFIEAIARKPYYMILMKPITAAGLGGSIRMCKPHLLKPYEGGVDFVDAYLNSLKV